MERLTGGAKRQAVLDPLPSVPRMPRRGAERAIRWIEAWCLVPKGYGAGEPMRVHPFQRRIIRAALADPKVRATLVSIARGNGKSLLAAALALHALLDPRDDPPEVLIVSSNEATAGIILDTCRRMVEAHPELSSRVIAYKDKLVCPGNGGVLRTLPSSESALHGHAPTTLILDELWLVDERVWSACVTSAGKRPQSRVIAISTPAATREAFMWRLVLHGRAGVDPTFRLMEVATWTMNANGAKRTPPSRPVSWTWTGSVRCATPHHRDGFASCGWVNGQTLRGAGCPGMSGPAWWTPTGSWSRTRVWCWGGTGRCVMTRRC